VFRVGRKVVPEMLKVDSLATLDQLQRHLTVEVKVPHIAQEPDILPVADAGQEGVHQHHPIRGLWELGRVGVGDHQPDVMPDDPDPIELQG
jgi:hypothetical protein